VGQVVAGLADLRGEADDLRVLAEEDAPLLGERVRIHVGRDVEAVGSLLAVGGAGLDPVQHAAGQIVHGIALHPGASERPI
jgi:hypothetical protein